MRHFAQLLLASLLSAIAGTYAHATEPPGKALEGRILHRTLSGQQYEIKEALFYKGNTYSLQSMTSGAVSRLHRMKETVAGFLD